MKKRIMPIVLLLLFLIGCGAEKGYETEFFAMDTVMQLHLYTEQDAKALSREVMQEINTLERSLSVTDTQSEVARLNRGEALSPDDRLRTLLEQTLSLHERTAGCLDPTIYPIVKLWGFTTGEYRVPEANELEAALQHAGAEHIRYTADKLQLDNGTELDFGAVAKGYAAERCAAILQGNAVGILSLGGNIQTVGSKPDGSPWLVGITDPKASAQSIATLKLEGTQAVVTSGGYQRFFEKNGVRYSHIMDPKTGQSVQNGMRSVTVVAGSGFLADGLSTALYVMGSEEAIAFWRNSEDFEMVLITDAGILVSEGLADCFSSERDYQVIQR